MIGRDLARWGLIAAGGFVVEIADGLRFRPEPRRRGRIISDDFEDRE